MRKLSLLLVLPILPLTAFYLATLDFSQSLHATRSGKAYWYAAENGGFETLTKIPMKELACQNCHAATKADGTPIDPETYAPGCDDCHNFAQGSAVAQSTCLGCHSRQGAEISLSSNPTIGHLFTDVHRDAGMVCTDCHTKQEFPWTPHVGAPEQFISMFDPGARYADCENCHNPAQLPQNTSHATHLDAVECSACHAKTMIACYNCHFETELAIDKKRFYGPPPQNGFALLVNDENTGKVTTASYQSVAYGDTTFYAIGPFGAHTITRDARPCSDCHDNSTIQAYNASGTIDVARWDDGTSTIVNTKGIIPVPMDWKTALKLDFVRFTGDPSDPVDSPGDPTKWEFMKSTADGSQMLFATPLTAAQMAILSVNMGVAVDEPDALPSGYELAQNYPNPFNPATVIPFALPDAGDVEITVYDAAGRPVAVLQEGFMPAGRHAVAWQADDLASGVYFYRLRAGDFRASRSMLLVK